VTTAGFNLRELGHLPNHPCGILMPLLASCRIPIWLDSRIRAINSLEGLVSLRGRNLAVVNRIALGFGRLDSLSRTNESILH